MDGLELVRTDVGLRFRWEPCAGFIDISPLAAGSPGVYEGARVGGEYEFSITGLTAFAESWITANGDLLRS
jgi:hypothetical protein